MTRKHNQVTFKPYAMNQPSLLPPSLDELIPEHHLVRVVNCAIEQIKLEPLLAQYKGGGTSSFHPKMMLKVLVYAYTQRIYTSRQIAKALRENIYFMWLSGRNTPDFRTLNDFRGRIMKPIIDEVFGAVVAYLVEAGYVQLEHYFLDGTKIEANANKHKVVWAKRNRKQQERLQSKIQRLLQEIEETNATEQAKYGEKDLEETGDHGGNDGSFNAERLREKIAELNGKLASGVTESARATAPAKALHTLEQDCLPRQERYEAQERTLAGRNSYAKTDPDATCLRMKEDRGAEKPWPKPAYNVQLGTENQFVVGFSLHARAGDTACLIPHLRGVQTTLGRLPENVTADAGYGSEENYAYLAEHHLGNFVKYNTFHQDQIRHRKPELLRQQSFRSQNFPYDAAHDAFLCPAEQPLTYRATHHLKTENGYATERRVYECGACATCAWKAECTKAKGNRQMRVSFRLQQFRAQARQNLLSEQGKALRARRSTEVETVFGQIKHNMRFRRFWLRGQAKVKTEWGLICIAHNMKKLAN
ncbi:MAG TPA: IS1182 family transposase [Anaerolineae bacterium]